MMRDERRYHRYEGGSVVSALICFGVMILLAALLFIMAFILWLGELVGSIMMATFIIGVLFALVAMIVYIRSAQPALEHIREQTETIYEVAVRARDFAEWLGDKLSFFGLFRHRSR